MSSNLSARTTGAVAHQRSIVSIENFCQLLPSDTRFFFLARIVVVVKLMVIIYVAQKLFCVFHLVSRANWTKGCQPVWPKFFHRLTHFTTNQMPHEFRNRNANRSDKLLLFRQFSIFPSNEKQWQWRISMSAIILYHIIDDIVNRL